MIAAGVALLAAGASALIFGAGGYYMRRRWASLDPGDQRLTPAGRFQLARQKAYMQQAPFWAAVGIGMAAIGLVLVILGVVTGS